MSSYDKDVKNCVSGVLSCGCLSLLVLIWLVADIWPDPSYIAIKANEKKIDAIQAQLKDLQTLIEHTQETLDNTKYTKFITPEPNAIKP